MVPVARKFAPFLVVCMLLVASPTVTAYMVHSPKDTITVGVRVHGIDIGGLTKKAAAAYLSGYFTEFASRPVEITYGLRTWTLIPKEGGVRVNIDAVLAEAADVAKEGSLITRWRMRNKVEKYGLEIPIQLTVDNNKLDGLLSDIADSIEKQPKDAVFVIRGEQVELVPSLSGIGVDRTRLKEDFLAACRSVTARIAYVSTYTKLPQRTTQSALAMGITRRIAQYTTKFDPEDTDRNNNIRLAADALKHLVLAPGEQFSFNQVTGPRLAADGYRPAPVIIDGELLPGIGGGVCQVSSTLYNVVLLAGLEVTSRVSHSLPVKYVPMGQDATVAYDYLDFQFTNTTPNHLLVDTKVTDNELQISFYGTPSVNGIVKLRSEVVGLIEPNTKQIEDSSLAPGAWAEVRAGRPGYRVMVHRIVEDELGNMVIQEKVSETVYPPRDRIVHISSSRKNVSYEE